MAQIKFNNISIGSEWTQNQLASEWGYRDYNAIRRGIVTPSGQNVIVLFVTNKKVKEAVQYVDRLDGDILYMSGQSKHGTDKRLLNNLGGGEDIIHLFYRDEHHTPFIYYGECLLINTKINEDTPSEFQFLIKPNGMEFDDESLLDYIANVPNTPNSPEQDFINRIDGIKKMTTHIRYERNPKNREAAIKSQGHICKICGFDFNKVYGPELSRDFIEVHHIQQVSEGEKVIDPEKDLIVVCSNCHRMLHRKKSGNISIEKIKVLPGVEKLRVLFS